MDVIIMESKAYQELMAKLDHINEFIRSLLQKKEVEEVKEIKEDTSYKVQSTSKDVWIDSNAVCEMLNISSRTLYRLRKERLIGYSTLRGRCRFKQSDVEQILEKRLILPEYETMSNS